MEKKLLLASLSLLSASNAVLCEQTPLLEAEILEACLAEEAIAEALCHAAEQCEEEAKKLSDIAHNISQHAHDLAHAVQAHAADSTNVINPLAACAGNAVGTAAGVATTGLLTSVVGPVAAGLAGQEVAQIVTSAVTETADFLLDDVETFFHSATGKSLTDAQMYDMSIIDHVYSIVVPNLSSSQSSAQNVSVAIDGNNLLISNKLNISPNTQMIVTYVLVRPTNIELDLANPQISFVENNRIKVSCPVLNAVRSAEDQLVQDETYEVEGSIKVEVIQE